MKSNYLLKVMCPWQLITLCLFSAVIITGCGSGSSTTAGVGSGGTGTLAKISGTVADGYLVNATVFLDKNGNYQLDAAEPFTATDANGSYTLEIDSTAVGIYPIVAHAIKAVTIDKDNGQPLTSSYVLSLPKNSVHGTVSNFISPLTSQIREMMETGVYTSLQHASDSLSNKLGLTAGTDIMGDYIHANNTSIHAVAQNMATVMGNQMDLVLGTNGSTITVDVNRYRGMMGTIYNDMSSSWCQYPQSGMSNFSNSMTTMLSGMSTTPTGQPYWDMSTAYWNMTGGMMGR